LESIIEYDMPVQTGWGDIIVDNSPMICDTDPYWHRFNVYCNHAMATVWLLFYWCTSFVTEKLVMYLSIIKIEISVSDSVLSGSACWVSNLVQPVPFEMDLIKYTHRVKRHYILFWIKQYGEKSINKASLNVHIIFNTLQTNKQTQWLFVRKRTIPTDRQPLVGEF
jgi:hypothetical protein